MILRNIKWKEYIFHPYTLIMFVLFIKITAFQIIIFDNTSLLHVLFIEFPMWAIILAGLLLLFKKRNWLTIWLFSLVMSTLFIVILYYTRYFSTVPSYYDVKQIYQSNSVGGTVALLGTPYDFLFLLDVVLILPLIWYFTGTKKQITFQLAKKSAIAFSCIGLITTAIAFFYPLVDVSYFAKKHGYIQSQFVQFYERGFGTAFAKDEQLTDEEIAELKGNVFVPPSEHETFGIAKNRHVFTIQVESLQEFTINQTINGQEITPNLNKLLKDSAYFNNVYQQIGAGNTSDAEWLMHTSLYPEGMDPTVNVIDEGDIPSLVRTLERNGYGTATYHADDITYWSRDKLYPALGFDYVYTNEEIPNEKEIGFGPADEVLFRFVEEQLPNQLKDHSLMYSNIITITSHTPFDMPDEYEYLDLPDSYKDTYVGNYLQSVRYTDEQIGDFIQSLKEMGIYDDSIILIYGDHSGLHGAPVTDHDYELLKEILGHDYNLHDRFVVPVLFNAPGIFNGETYSQLGGQIDLMPTLLNLLGMEHDRQMIGHNLFQYEKNLLGMRYYMPGGSFISNNTLYTAPSAKLPALLYNRETMKKTKNTQNMQKNIENTLQVLQYSDYIRKEMSKRD
ncbi:phosphoglycerol transferase MdoB-like AlkP superfamily enzyme [Cytobacillus eiseniae]|uniref:Phosphoglycerol transferase MdoB-like AlkP superfamily enzyme n=1 Tax=Cytobacillus eiseniae TaxID=762947 RepID=A0ABS4RK76_9BACI|nr:LTA synthase family protein [Cytobacillus eiseniae]MBP2243312.1 phosphoglycerol transferase MdoB-like AlkP superfamily enzyme [Cytobacillus eiseniae]